MHTTNLAEQSTQRQIIYRTTGQRHGPIIRLMSPSDLGQIIKPFVFLDLFEGDSSLPGSMPMHPHSGIATVTVITEGNLHFDDLESDEGTIDYGGVEWMRAGGGVWHGKEMSAGTSESIQGFQLWIALPPELENASVDSQYLESSVMPQVGPARLIIGAYQGVQSPVRAPDGINYLLVTIPAGESWTYTPPKGHESLWLSVSRGALHLPSLVNRGEMVVFTPGNHAVTMKAKTEDAVFVIGSAEPHPHNLILGSYSVHTNAKALQAGEAKIEEIGVRLREYLQKNVHSTALPAFK
ncbi:MULTISPECIES: pirin family protein [Serratia]|uniref:pirin family protein n=1 Tax=Serratia TaxID=613 RepID=UPI00217C83A4|nr:MULTISPECIES: pirin family protein [Serratia]CAI1036030.1 Pirin [Serratia quinivorans]CAI1144171.1 Pirin [Serratia quinivorans]CAI1177076.1 Pirin [Serratia quinivorans]CAI1941252.1 Pirin [Serratia liquefaciens]CAI2131131.1 Pirin [Serratia quinivorans]